MGQELVELLVKVPYADLGVPDDLPFPRFERRLIAVLVFTVITSLIQRLFHA